MGGRGRGRGRGVNQRQALIQEDDQLIASLFSRGPEVGTPHQRGRNSPRWLFHGFLISVSLTGKTKFWVKRYNLELSWVLLALSCVDKSISLFHCTIHGWIDWWISIYDRSGGNRSSNLILKGNYWWSFVIPSNACHVSNKKSPTMVGRWVIGMATVTVVVWAWSFQQ